MPDISKTAIDAVKVLFVSLSFVAVVLRLVANWKYNRKLLVDDFAVSALSDLAGDGFHDPKSSPHRVAQVRLPSTTHQQHYLNVKMDDANSESNALWTCKAPILFLYIRLFGIKKWLRITSYVTLGLTAAIYTTGIVAIPPACTPHTTDLSEAFIDGCQARTRTINVFLGSTSVLADVIILVLPLPVVFGLNLLIKSRIGLAILFLSGLFAIASSIISLYLKVMTLRVATISLATPILATITECTVALIVGCVPSLRVLWSKILKPGVKTSRENAATDPTGNRTNRGISQYIVVGDGADRKTSESNTALVISTEVHTSTSTVADYGRPGEVQPPLGVYTEAYALQTRHQGVWGR
ncbi:hypothetical protein EKO27_g11140 [Xylaria grammica]|uniref:Rhodopsin domain-containing protein n=1 Tax=Xylaria grammica TaxID=363999 RepID=A0A439CP91_9PEZI|nr:hypothetical protein EKO27_g11140 [Xylaria grammica]